MLSLLRQYSHRRDLRHLKALAWMVTALVCSSRLSLPEWEAYVPSRAHQAQSTERRWQRFMSNHRVRIRCAAAPLADPGLPIGLQLVGSPQAETALLQFAYLL